MKELWRKTFELFRRYLVLWLPCTFAGLLGLGLARLEKAAVLGITQWRMTRHSVLGGEFVSTDPSEFQRLALRIAMLLGVCRQFLMVCLFVTALVITATLVRMIRVGEQTDLMLARRGIVSEMREILLFTFKYMLAGAAMGGIMLVSTYLAEISPRLFRFASTKAFIYPVALALEGGVAWFLMPSAMRLLHATNDSQITVRMKRLGTAFMVLTSAAGMALEFLVGRVEAGLTYERQWETWAVSVLNNIVTNAPQVLLFIALALLAAEISKEDENDGTPDSADFSAP